MGLEKSTLIPSVESGHVGWAIFGDQHQSVVGETTPLSAVPYDHYVPTSIRPPALVLVSGLINARANRLLVEYDEQGWNAELAGDMVDASTPHEWVLFLSTRIPDSWKYFVPEVQGTPSAFSWEGLSEALLIARDQYELFSTRPGNHEGRRLGSFLGTTKRQSAIDQLIPKDQWASLGGIDFLSKADWINHYRYLRYPEETLNLKVQSLEHGTRLHATPENQSQLFSHYWQQKQNGDYLCHVQVANAELAEGSEPILLQARRVGVVGGHPIYEMVFDTSDMSDALPKTAAIGELSGLQKDLWQLFINQMRLQESAPLFVPQGHISLGEQDPANLEKFDWPEFFKQENIIPVFLCANGHHRDIAFEHGVWNIMVPSVLDADNEFMTVDLSYDERTSEYVITQEYRDVIPQGLAEDSEAQTVVQQFQTELSPLHYQDYSELSTRPLPTAWNIFFRKGAIARDTDLVQLRSIRENLRYVQEYLELLTADPHIPSEFVKLVEDHQAALSSALEDDSLTAPTPEILEHAQALQFLISQTPEESLAARAMLALGFAAAEGEGQRGEQHGLLERAPEIVPDRNVFRWNSKTGVIVRVSTSL